MTRSHSEREPFPAAEDGGRMANDPEPLRARKLDRLGWAGHGPSRGGPGAGIDGLTRSAPGRTPHQRRPAIAAAGVTPLQRSQPRWLQRRCGAGASPPRASPRAGAPPPARPTRLAPAARRVSPAAACPLRKLRMGAGARCVGSGAPSRGRQCLMTSVPEWGEDRSGRASRPGRAVAVHPLPGGCAEISVPCRVVAHAPQKCPDRQFRART